MKTSLFAMVTLGGCAAAACAQTTGAYSAAITPRGEAIAPAAGFGAAVHSVPLQVNNAMLSRQYSLEYLALADMGDPREGGAAGAAANVIGGGGQRPLGRAQFYSAPFKGVSGGASFLNERIDGDAANRAWGMSVGMSFGALTLRAAHQNRHVAQIRFYDQAGNSLEARNSLAAANLRFTWGTAYAAYSVNRGWGSSPLFNPDNPYGAGLSSTPSSNSRDVLLGVAVPAGHTTLLASFIRRNDHDLSNRDATQFALGASYALTRRTDFYAAYSVIRNTGGAGLAAVAPGVRTPAFNLGMRHAF